MLVPPPRLISQAGAPSFPAGIPQLATDHWIPGNRWLERFRAFEVGWLADADGATQRVPLVLEHAPLVPEQGYQLLVQNDGAIHLRSATERGAWYGLLTLKQQVEVPTSSWSDITDHPALEHRGVMLDVSRCKVPTLDTLFELIDWLAGLKINQVQLYTEHSFAYAGHELVWRDSSPYTAEDIRRIDAYCHARFIELVPNQNSFGHFERWIKHPEYRHLAESPDGFTTPWGTQRDCGSVLRPEPETLALLDDLYTQLLPNFRSRQFNIGCDETFELGQGYSKARCDEQGRTRVYLDFFKQIHARAVRDGHTPMFWGDIIHSSPELIAELPRPITALEWGYEADHPFAERCADFARHDVPFYVCPGTSSWRSIVGRTTNMMANVREAVRVGQHHGAVGCLMTDWGDLGHTQTFPISLPGFVLGASLAWNPSGLNQPGELAAALDQHALYTPGLGAWLLELGRVQDIITSRAFNNNSPFFHLLFTKHYEAWSPTAEEQAACLARYHELAEAFEPLAAACPDARMVDELRLSLAQFRFSLTRDLLDLPGLIEHHRRVWLVRNRPGGLEESLDYFRAEQAPTGNNRIEG